MVLPGLLPRKPVDRSPLDNLVDDCFLSSVERVERRPRGQCCAVFTPITGLENPRHVIYGPQPPAASQLAHHGKVTSKHNGS